MAQVLAGRHTDGLATRLTGIIRHPYFVFAIICLEMAFAVHLYVIAASRELLPDLAVYVHAAEALRRGENIYNHPFEVEFVKGEFFRLRYLYPPLLAHVLSKFLFLGRDTLFFCWNILSFLAICGSVISISLLLKKSWWARFTLTQRMALVGFFTVCFEPLCSGVGHGQVSALVLFCLSLFLLHSVSGHEITAGIALACAIQLKMTPAVIVLAPLLFGRWRTLAWCGLSSVVLVLPTIVDTGSIGVFRDFLQSLSSTEESPVLRHNSFNFRVDKAILSPIGLFDNLVATGITRLFLTTALVVGCIAIRRQGEEHYLNGISFLVVGMVFVSPVIWHHHFTWLLIPLAVMTMSSARDEQERLKALTISLGIMFCLSKTYLIHITVYHSAPSLLGVSALVPCGLLMAMGIFLVRAKVDLETIRRRQAA